ncbi:MAG TPA: hypothetical protein VF190_15495 [Rhodothermales bacterium]
MHRTFSYRTALAVPVILALSIPFSIGGCLLGLGAAAGTAVGSCALMDDNEDEIVSEAEFSRGLFDAWDVNDDLTLTEAEFDAGTARSATYDDWTDDFDDWDADDDAGISATEFDAGVTQNAMVASLLDDQCDDLGL